MVTTELRRDEFDPNKGSSALSLCISLIFMESIWKPGVNLESISCRSAGADINTQAADGATALYEAAKNGHEEIVELLLSQNADANKPGRTGLLPLHIAAQRGSDT